MKQDFIGRYFRSLVGIGTYVRRKRRERRMPKGGQASRRVFDFIVSFIPTSRLSAFFRIRRWLQCAI